MSRALSSLKGQFRAVDLRTGGGEYGLQARLRAPPRRPKAGLQAFRKGLDRELAQETWKVRTLICAPSQCSFFGVKASQMPIAVAFW